MLDPKTCKYRDLVICIDDHLPKSGDEDDVKFRCLFFGNVYEVSEIRPESEIENLLFVPGLSTGYVVCFTGVGNDDDLFDAVNWYSTERFVPFDEYSNVVKLYRDLIRNPPRNASC